MRKIDIRSLRLLAILSPNFFYEDFKGKIFCDYILAQKYILTYTDNAYLKRRICMQSKENSEKVIRHCVSLNPDITELLQRIAKTYGISKSGVIAMAIKTFNERNLNLKKLKKQGDNRFGY